MSDLDMTAEEQAALDAMQSDEGGNERSEPEDHLKEPDGEPEKAEDQGQKEPEFKSTRDDVKPVDWASLSPEQQVDISRFVHDGKPPAGFVPHGALHSEREKAKAVASRLEAIEAKLAEQTAEQPPEFVDPLIDPEGFRKWADYRDSQQKEQTAKYEAAQEQQFKQAERIQRAAAFDVEFTKSQPDYPDAATHYQNVRIAEMRGLGMSDAEISNEFAQEIGRLFDAGVNSGINPAQLVYMRAQQAGYKRAEPERSDADKIAARAEAQKQTQGLSNAGGAEQAGGLTMEQIANMSEAEFNKIPEDKLRALMGA